MKKIIVTIAIIINAIASFAQTEGKLYYQKVTQSYKGDTVYVKLNTDTTNYWTDKNAFGFNKDIYVKGVKLGSGGGSDVAKYLKNYNPADTVISIYNKNKYGLFIDNDGYSVGIVLKNRLATGMQLINEGMDGLQITNINSYSIGAHIGGYGIYKPIVIDSAGLTKFTINSSGVPKINRYAGTGNRQIVVNSSGEIVLGAPSSLIATQLKNYNINQDTVIRFPNLATGKFGVWQNINSGSQNYIATNSGKQNYIATNSLNSNQNFIAINNGEQNYISLNNLYQNFITTNNSTQNYVENNNGNQIQCINNNSVFLNLLNNSRYSFGFKITYNRGYGVAIYETNRDGAGIFSYVADSVSLTSPARTGIFGKSGYYTDIDGFGQLRLYRNNILKLKIDTAGHILNNPPHAYSIDTTSNFNITLTQNVWKQVTNATKNFWSNNAELDYFSFTGDTVVLAKQGHYTGDFNINIAGASGATYEYRIIQKNGTTKIVNKFTVKGTGEIAYRNVPFYVQGVKGTKIWVEIRFTGAPTGSPITVTGGLFRIFPIHLQ